ncbi:uncharacterized protein LOC143347364 [Colletes latitarsis]|uniref:uncharacterized protein LOC143347364 n=1 Tax=Colletes latitarsis TaxID=2605962 RepID=UPI0040356EA1
MMSKESDVDVRIQQTLFAIYQVTTKIKNELEMINHLIKGKGQLHETVINANKKLTTVVENLGLNINDIISENGEENKLP